MGHRAAPTGTFLLRRGVRGRVCVVVLFFLKGRSGREPTRFRPPAAGHFRARLVALPPPGAPPHPADHPPSPFFPHDKVVPRPVRTRQQLETIAFQQQKSDFVEWPRRGGQKAVLPLGRLQPVECCFGEGGETFVRPIGGECRDLGFDRGRMMGVRWGLDGG